MLLEGLVNCNKGTINFSHGFSTKYFTESDKFNCSTTFSAEYDIQVDCISITPEMLSLAILHVESPRVVFKWLHIPLASRQLAVIHHTSGQ